MSKNGSNAIVVTDDRTPRLAGDDSVTVLLSSEDTAGRYAMVEITTEPGGGVTMLHTHPPQETFHILEGRYEIYGRDEAGNKYTIPALTGSTVHIPGGTPHAYQNVGDTPGKLLLIFEPAGIMEVFFEEISIPVENNANPPTPTGAPDMEALLKVAAKYHIHFVEAPQA